MQKIDYEGYFKSKPDIFQPYYKSKYFNGKGAYLFAMKQKINILTISGKNWALEANDNK